MSPHHHSHARLTNPTIAGKLPSHGFARRSVWELDEVGDGTATFSLKPTDAIKAMWDHAFTLHYTVTLGADTLTTTLK